MTSWNRVLSMRLCVLPLRLATSSCQLARGPVASRSEKHWKSIEKALKSIEKALKSIEKAMRSIEKVLQKHWKSIEKHWKSIEKHWNALKKQRKSIEKALKSIENRPKPVPWPRGHAVTDRTRDHSTCDRRPLPSAASLNKCCSKTFTSQIEATRTSHKSLQFKKSPPQPPYQPHRLVL